jgi:cyclopropane-fatty-acyl-phospholipid synthase
MAERAQLSRDKTIEKALAAVHELLRDYHPRNFAVEFWDGTHWEPDPGQFCRFTWKIKRPSALRAALRSGRQVALSEAYVHGDFDIDGDILAIFPVAEHLAEKRFTAAEKLKLGTLLLGLPSTDHNGHLAARLRGRPHTKSRDRQAVTFHYDVSNDFYRLWLDPAMVYSCAYFKSPEDTLETAQRQKFDYICRKLRLRPGERLLDIGCGWGGLILHAAKNYGVQALGITLSEQQLKLAQQKIRDSDLLPQCEARLLDYRDARQLGEFDKLVSVGMVEHVGESALSEYFRTAYSVLKPGGVFLNHGIGRAGNRAKPSHPTFTDTYVFPDGDLIPIWTTLRAAEEAGFEVRDLENLREHYFLTLYHWLRNLEASQEQARALVGELKYRIWRLYLAGSAYYFQTGKLDLYQSLLVKSDGGRSGMPLTRADWYRA